MNAGTKVICGSAPPASPLAPEVPAEALSTRREQLPGGETRAGRREQGFGRKQMSKEQSSPLVRLPLETPEETGIERWGRAQVDGTDASGDVKHDTQEHQP